MRNINTQQIENIINNIFKNYNTDINIYLDMKNEILLNKTIQSLIYDIIENINRNKNIIFDKNEIYNKTIIKEVVKHIFDITLDRLIDIKLLNDKTIKKQSLLKFKNDLLNTVVNSFYIKHERNYYIFVSQLKRTDILKYQNGLLTNAFIKSINSIYRFNLYLNMEKINV